MLTTILGSSPMAAFTTQRPGNWSDTSISSPWYVSGATPCPIPGAGDTASIGHAVSVTGDTTVGTSGATGTAAVTIARPGVLTITGATLTLHGDLIGPGYNSGTITTNLVLGASGGIEFDPPTGARYAIFLDEDVALATSGTSAGSRAFVRTKPGAAGLNGYFKQNNDRQNLLNCTHIDFTRLGDSGQAALVATATTIAATFFVLDDATFTGCGAVSVATDQGGSTVSLTNCRWTGSTGATGLGFTGALTTGTRLLQFCSFDTFIQGEFRDVTLDECAFLAAFVGLDSFPWASWAGGMIVNDAANDNVGLVGDATDVYSVNPAAANPHSLGVPSGGTLAGAIFEAPNDTSAVGDFVFLGGTGAQTVTGCLLLPSAASGHSPGKLISCIDASSTSGFLIHANHNTVCSSADGGEQGVVAIGENYDGHAGMVAEMKSNLAWSPAAGAGSILSYQGVSGSPVAGVIATGACDYNGRYNLGPGNRPVAGAVSGYYDANTGEMFTGADSPDPHGVTANPQFVAPTRNLQTWAQSQHGADGTLAGALAVVAADPTLLPALRAWVRGGFAPTNAAYHGTAHDATDIGAVAYQAAGHFLRINMEGGMNTINGGMA